MTVGFVLDLADVMAFQRHYLNTNTSMLKTKKMVSIYYPIFLLLAGIAITVTMLDTFDVFTFLPLILLVVAWIVFVPHIFIRLTLKRAIKIMLKPENKGLLGQRELTFGESGVHIAYEGGSMSTLWEFVVKIHEQPHYFFLFTTSYSGIVIPKQKLAASEVDALHSLLAAHIDKYTYFETEN